MCISTLRNAQKGKIVPDNYSLIYPGLGNQSQIKEIYKKF
jgi:hypothetical protein